MLENDVTLAAMAEALAKSANYRVLRRLVPRTTLIPSIGQSTKTSILLDVEPALGLLFSRGCHARLSMATRLRPTASRTAL